MHDLIAELQGYRNELAHAERYNMTDQVAAVRVEVARVAASIRDHAAVLLDRAAAHEGNGQDALADLARREARRLSTAVDEAPASSDAADSTPRETATTRRKRA